jgi:DNA-binding transcriptional LysR family regulator
VGHAGRLDGPDALELLRAGKIEVAIIFRYDETEPEPPGVRLHHLLDDPVYLLSSRHEGGELATLSDATWIAGCERCRSHLLSLCADAGFDPRIGYVSDDMVVMASWRQRHGPQECGNPHHIPSGGIVV